MDEPTISLYQFSFTNVFIEYVLKLDKNNQIGFEIYGHLKNMTLLSMLPPGNRAQGHNGN